VPRQQRGADGPEHAVLVVGVSADSPAEAAGVLVGDLILAFDGQPVRSPEDLLEALTSDRVGKAVQMKVLRGGRPDEVTVTVGERPKR
jgi:S1-C subfamily serine protease